MKKSARINKICPCGKNILVAPRLINRKKYCSKKCQYKYYVKSCGFKRVDLKPNPSWFKKGHSLRKGIKLNQSSIEKMRLKLMGRRLSPKTEFKKGQVPFNKGKSHNPEELHPNWKGDDVGYNALHAWVVRKLGKPEKCERCNTTKSKRFMWHNISYEYKRELNDWERLCAKCHAHEHKNWEGRIWLVV